MRLPRFAELQGLDHRIGGAFAGEVDQGLAVLVGLDRTEAMHAVGNVAQVGDRFFGELALVLQQPLEDDVLKLVATDARADPAAPA